MTGRATWWRWVAGLMAALLLASLGPAPASAGLLACPDDAPAVADTADAAPLATAYSPTDICIDGCLACGHCQSHHTAVSLPTGLPAEIGRFAHPEPRSPVSSSPPRSHLAEGLRRPPRA